MCLRVFFLIACCHISTSWCYILKSFIHLMYAYSHFKMIELSFVFIVIIFPTFFYTTSCLSLFDPCAISLQTSVRSTYFQSSPSLFIPFLPLIHHIPSPCPLTLIIYLSFIITTLLSSLIHILIDLSFLSIHTHLPHLLPSLLFSSLLLSSPFLSSPPLF